MVKILNEVFDGKISHSCTASINRTSNIGAKHLDPKNSEIINHINFLSVPKQSVIECNDSFGNKYLYGGKLTREYYRITQHLAVYEPYIFFKDTIPFVVGKFYPFPQKQSNVYNAIVDTTFYKDTTFHLRWITRLRVTRNLDISFDGYWANILVNHGDLITTMMILHQNRFLRFSKKIEMKSQIEGDKVYTVIRDTEMAYKLNATSKPILATGTLYMLDTFYEARAEIPESSWRAFVEDFFTFELIPLTAVPMAGFGKVLLQAIKTMKVSFYFKVIFNLYNSQVVKIIIAKSTSLSTHVYLGPRLLKEC